MSDPILPFAVWQSGTNQNSIPANDNALRAEILSSLVISESTDAQPGSPARGDIYIMTGAASGTQWATFDQYDLAIYDGAGTWHAYAPLEGIVVNVAGTLKRWNGSAYVAVSTGGVPTGGTAGQVLRKIDGTDYNTEWGTPAGGGDVVGPASSVADHVALFDGATGKLLKDGGKTIAEIKQIEQNSQSGAYTMVLADAGKHILHPSADTTARIFTIPANSSVAYPVGTAITIVNQNAAGVVTIAITSDTMRLAGAGTTGSRTLAANGVATALKITSTEWIISGTGLS